MAKQVIPEELDALIQDYLTDGIITGKERQVLLRKAEKLGLDVDEVDLYIDAQQQKADQQVDAAVRKQRGQTCPYCGGSVPQLADKCPHCSQHITAEASDELKEIIENLEEALVDFKSGRDIAKSQAVAEKYLRKAKLYYSNNPKIEPLIAEVTAEIASTKTEAVARAKEAAKLKASAAKTEARKEWFRENKKWAVPVGGCLIVLIIYMIIALVISIFTIKNL